MGLVVSVQILMSVGRRVDLMPITAKPIVNVSTLLDPSDVNVTLDLFT